MKQLLTLNESIEELKNKRLYGVSKESLDDSNYNLKDSTCQLNKTVSSLSIGSGYGSCLSEDETNVKGLLSNKRYSYQDSDDSGCGEWQSCLNIQLNRNDAANLSQWSVDSTELINKYSFHARTKGESDKWKQTKSK